MLKVPITLTVTTLTKRPRSCGASLPSVRSASAMPAQFTSTCRPPNSFSASATAALPSASDETSVLAKRPPISFASFSPSFDLQVGDHDLAAVLGRHARGRRAETRRAAGDEEYAISDLHRKVLRE